MWTNQIPNTYEMSITFLVYFEFCEIHWSVPTLVEAIEYFLYVICGQVVCYAFEEGDNLRETQGMVIVHIYALEQF